MDVPWFYRMPKHGFIVEKKMRLMAHDEYELCEQGDLVTPRPSHSHARSPCAQPRREAKRVDGAEMRCVCERELPRMRWSGGERGPAPRRTHATHRCTTVATQQPSPHVHVSQLRAECEPLRAQVQLRMSRKLSKHKSHVVQAIVKKEDGSEPPDPYPTVPL